MRIDVILAVLMAIAFFLPWANGGSGFDAVREMLLSDVPVEDALAASGFPTWLLYVLYALPVAIVLTIIIGLAGGPANLFAIIAGAAPWVLVVYPVVALDAQVDQLVQVLQFGAYATLVIGVLLFLAGLGLMRTRR